MKVGTRVLSERLAATPDMTALPTDAKMHPPPADLQALLATAHGSA
jgi:hypothetical protein